MTSHDDRDANDQHDTAGDGSRRGLLRTVGTAAAGAAFAAPLLSARSAGAADGDSLVIGAENSGSSGTQLFAGVEAANKSVLDVADDRREIDIEGAISGMATGASVSNGVVGFTSAPGPTVESGHALVAYPLDLPGDVPPPRSNLWLRPQLPDPRTSGQEHTPGELVSDEDGDVWHCVVRGTPGTWRRISGATTAGAFVSITPARVYDSRLTSGTGGGRIAADTDRLVGVADFQDIDGNLVETDGVPFGATAVAYNLAIVNPADRGYLFLAPGDATAVTAASINWDLATTGAVNSGSVVKLDDARRVKVFCGGGALASTDFVLDVVGYYL